MINQNVSINMKGSLVFNCFLNQGWGSDGTVWFASEMKALQSVCDHMEVFPPGHYYTATAGGTDKVRESVRIQLVHFMTQSFLTKRAWQSPFTKKGGRRR